MTSPMRLPPAVGHATRSCARPGSFRAKPRPQRPRSVAQSLTGAPREILKQDDKVICLLPKDRKLTTNLPTPKALFPTLSPERLQQIAHRHSPPRFEHSLFRAGHFFRQHHVRVPGRPCQQQPRIAVLADCLQ